MKKITLKALLCVFVFLSVLPFARPVLAHSDEPRLEISVERINPGGIVEVRGVNFGEEEFVVLTLMLSSTQIPLGVVTTDVEGTFTQIVVLPSDLPTGEFNFRASSDHHMVVSPIMTVWGVAVENQESNGFRDQSDLELGPVPTIAPSVVPGMVATTVLQTIAQETPASNRNNVVFLSIAVLVGILVVGGVGIARKR